MNGSSPLSSSSSNNKRRAADKHQRVVQTPYGRGCVIRTRPDQMQEIQLLEWDMSLVDTKKNDPDSPSSKHAITMLYSATKFPSVPPVLNDDVLTVYGRGRVVYASLLDRRCHVELMSWRLAGRSKVQCFLGMDVVQVVRKKTLYELTDPYERVAYAMEQKKRANLAFGHHHYERARSMYSNAVNAVRYIQHTPNSPNELRADLVQTMITCCNNAGTCSANLSQWDDSIQFSSMALNLLQALYEKRGLKIHSILNKEGLSDVKLFGEWRVKSWFRLGQAYYEQHKYTESLQVLKQAREAIAQYSTTNRDNVEDEAAAKQLLGQDKQVRKLYAACLQRKKAEKQKEKQRAVAMFASTTKDNDSSSESNKEEAAGGPTSDRADAQMTEGEASLVSPASRRTVPTVTPSPRSIGLEVKNSRVSNEQVRLDAFSTPSTSTSKDLDTGNADDVVDADENEAWYEEHKEALILSASVTGLAALSFLLLRGSRR